MSEICIIVPAYNVEKYVSSCIESILNQSFKDFEVIIVDDGSIDNTASIIDALVETDSRIKVFHKANAGVSSARNFGLDKVNSKFVMFVDSDDIIHPQTLEIMYETISTTNADMVKCKFVDFQNESELIFSHYHIDDNDLNKVDGGPSDVQNLIIDDKLVWSVWGALYRFDVIKEVRFELGKELGEDVPFTLKVLDTVGSYISIDSVLYYYRTNPNSIMHTFDRRIMNSYDHILMIMYEYYKDKYIDLFYTLGHRLLFYVVSWSRSPRIKKFDLKYDLHEIQTIKSILKQVHNLNFFKKSLTKSCTNDFRISCVRRWVIRAFSASFYKNHLNRAALLWYIYCLLERSSV